LGRVEPDVKALDEAVTGFKLGLGFVEADLEFAHQG